VVRRLLLVIALGGCDSEEDNVVGEPDTCEFTICQIDTIWATGPTSCQRPDFQNVRVIGTCEYGCKTGALNPGIIEDPCAAPPPKVYRCEQSGSCTVGATSDCKYPLMCGGNAVAGACTCDANGWSCQPGCRDGMCDPSEVQAAVTGTWSGMVTTPFGADYQATVTIDADGMWSSPGVPFYYGEGGGTPGSKFLVLAQTDAGAVGLVKIFEGSIDAELTAIRVDATRLRFEMIDSWLDCSRILRFDLQRQ
jgi:hypothetical protein